MAAARTNTPAAVRARAAAAGKKPTDEQVKKTVAKNTAHTNAVMAAKSVDKGVFNRSVAAKGVAPSVAAVQKTVANNAAFVASRKTVLPPGEAKVPGSQASAVAQERANPNSAVARAAGRGTPELTRKAVIGRARAAGKRPTTPQVTKTLAASRDRAAMRRAKASKTKAF